MPEIEDSKADLLEAYDYPLPADRIASHPAAERTASRLLVHDRAADRVQHSVFAEIGAHFAPGDLLILNDVRVIPARLEARRSTGARIEVLLHPTGHVPGQENARFVGQALLRPSSKVRQGETLRLPHGPKLRVLDGPGTALRGVSSDSALEELLAEGEIPLPPYLEREGPPTAEDAQRYQTVYAREGGAVAAPTAGLHFDRELLDQLAAQGVDSAFLTLHVGPGTFLPVRSEHLHQHRMQEEAYEIPEQTRNKIAACRAAGGRVIAVGTTTTRALESAVDDEGIPRSGPGRTELMIRPPHEFRAIDALLTNFHLPKSTLLCLVSAFAGRERVLDLYREAVERGYRFYSYGDAMLLV